MYVTVLDIPLRAGDATEARRFDISVALVFAQRHTAKLLTKGVKQVCDWPRMQLLGEALFLYFATYHSEE